MLGTTKLSAANVKPSPQKKRRNNSTFEFFEVFAVANQQPDFDRFVLHQDNVTLDFCIKFSDTLRKRKTKKEYILVTYHCWQLSK